MHQQFVTMAPVAWILTCLFAKPGYMPSTVGSFLWSKAQSFVKSPAQITAGKCEITPAGLGMESKALRFHGTAGTMLRSKHCN